MVPYAGLVYAVVMSFTPPIIASASPSGNEKVWSILSHLSSFIGLPILLPLAVWLGMRRESEFAANNAKEALNFHLSLFIYFLCSLPLFLILIGYFIWLLLGAVAIVFAIIAAIHVSEGRSYHYPLTLPLIR